MQLLRKSKATFIILWQKAEDAAWIYVSLTLNIHKMWGKEKKQRPGSPDTVSSVCRTPVDFKGFTAQKPDSYGSGNKNLPTTASCRVSANFYKLGSCPLWFFISEKCLEWLKTLLKSFCFFTFVWTKISWEN